MGKRCSAWLRKLVVLHFSFFMLDSSLSAAPSEVHVDLKLDQVDFVVGEPIRGVVNIVNSSPDRIAYGTVNVMGDEDGKKVRKDVVSGKDRFFIEVYRASDMTQLTRTSKGIFVSPFFINSGEGQKLETFLGRHYALLEPSRYLAKPVLVHRGMRFEGQLRAFDIVEGVRISTAMQMFKRHKGLQREFELVYWGRRDGEHLLLKAKDTGIAATRWETRDLGRLLRIDKPTISILQSGEVIVFHRYDRDWFSRSLFWSLPKAFEFRSQENVQDPETAGTQRVRELYKEGVKPKENPWWKFW